MPDLITRPLAKSSRMEMQAGAKSLDLYFYDAIGKAELGRISAKEVSAALRAAGPVGEIHVYAVSPGGDIYEALGIYTTLKDHPARVVMHITVAASAMTLIAMAGDQIEMAENGVWMIHPPRTYTEGTVEELQSDVEGLKRMRDSVNQTYAARTKLPLAEVVALVQATTWMTAAEAKAKGFVDAVTPNKSISAHADLSCYADVPAWAQQALLTLSKEAPKMADPVPTPPAPTPTPTPPAPPAPPPAPTPTPPAPTAAAPGVVTMTAVELTALVTNAVNAANQRTLDITALCNRCSVPQMAAAFIADPKIKVSDVNEQMMTLLIARNVPAGTGGTGPEPGTKGDPVAKYKAEFNAQADMLGKLGISEDDYVASRALTDGVKLPAKPTPAA